MGRVMTLLAVGIKLVVIKFALGEETEITAMTLFVYKRIKIHYLEMVVDKK